MGTSLISGITEGLGTEVFESEGFAYVRESLIDCDITEELRSGDEFSCRYRFPDGREARAAARISGSWFTLLDVEVKAGPAIVLTGRSIGPAQFGEPFEVAAAGLETTIGPPEDGPEFYSSGSCPFPVAGSWAWPSSALIIYFDASGGLVGYHYQGGEGPIGELETEDGIGVGDSVEILRQTYEDRLQAAQINPNYWEFTADRSLVFVTDGGAEDSSVKLLTAGSDCSFE